MFFFAHGRAKKIQNKAVVNTSMLMRESKAENSKALLAHGNSRTAGKRSLGPGQQQEGREQDGGRDRLQAQHGAWGGGHLLGITGALAQGSLQGHFGLYFEANAESHAIVRNKGPCPSWRVIFSLIFITIFVLKPWFLPRRLFPSQNCTVAT